MFIPHLTRWLRLPGKAGSPEPVWVTPRGVKPDEPGLVREPPSAGYYLVHDWFHDPDHFEPLEEMFVFLGGELHPSPCSVGDRIDPLVRAFDEERLWLWRVPVFAVSEPAVFPGEPIPTPASRPIEPTGTWRLVEFWLARADGGPATHVASGAEDPKPQFKWILDDPDHLITGGRLEFYRADAPELSGPVATLSLTLDQLLSLRRPFNGFTGASYLSCEFSPYRVRLVVEGLVGPPQALNYQVRVEPTRLDLHLGPRSLLSQPKDLSTYDILAGYESFDGNEPARAIEDEHALLPMPKGIARVVMEAHLFAVGTDQLRDAADAPFEALQLLWGDGAEIPLVASLYFRASDDSDRLAPRACGSRKVVWQWIEEPEDLGSLAAPVRAYVAAARNYRTSEPKPGSQLCHEDRGGKRSKVATKMFTTNARLPFGVRAHESDPTLAFSTPAENGNLTGRTGVIFSPPIQSGEHLKVAVFFDPKPIPGVDSPGTFDINQVVPRQVSRVFQTWHSINLVMHAAKRQPSSRESAPRSEHREGSKVMTEFSDLSATQDYFNPAYVVLRRLKVARRTYLQDLGDYDQTVKNVFAELQTRHVAPELGSTGIPEWHVAVNDSRPAPVSPKPGRESFLIKDHLFDTLASPAGVSAGLKVFAAIEVLERYGKFRGVPSTTDPKVLQALHRDLWAPEGGSASSSAHKNLAGVAALWVMGTVGSRLTPLGPGLRITEVHALMEDANGKVYDTDVGGVAFADHGRSGHVLVVQNFGPLDRTLAHELGHECFLPHPHGEDDANADPQAHDTTDPNCLMGGWHRLHFCGRCILRLRGWSMDGLVVATVEHQGTVDGTNE